MLLRFVQRSLAGSSSKLLCRQFMATGDSTPSIKRQKLGMKIGTHSGTFHCDEALACFMLKLLPDYKDADIVRSRNPVEWSTCDILVDVGGVYDPQTHRYDHHQRTFDKTMNSLCPAKKWTTKLSSAGLVYYHFGESILRQIIGKDANDDLVQSLFSKVYQNFMEEIDAIDNGVKIAEGDLRYNISTNLSSRVGHLNPSWNDPDEESDEKLDKLFQQAMALAGAEFMDKVQYYLKVWWPARKLVQAAIEKRYEVDASGEIICLSTSGCPWKDHLLDLEGEMQIKPTIKYALYTDTSGMWRIQCVPVTPTSFESRLPLLEPWRGLRDDELCHTSGIEGCTFVHASGFIGGNKTKEGVLEMARRTLNGK